MKTQVQKFTLIVAIVAASLTVNAQNTKSVHTGLLNNKLTNQVSGKVNHFSHELAIQLEKMKESIKFSPANIEDESFEATAATADHILAMNELEASVMFYPESIENNSFTASEALTDYKTVANELEDSVKYRPTEEICSQNINNCELDSLTSELANEVKFTPNAIL